MYLKTNNLKSSFEENQKDTDKAYYKKSFLKYAVSVIIFLVKKKQTNLRFSLTETFIGFNLPVSKILYNICYKP